MYLTCEKWNKTAGVGGPLLVRRSGLWPLLPLKSGLAAERSGSKSQMSGAEPWAGFKKLRGAWAGAGGRRSGNGAVSGTPANGAERWAGNFAAPLRSHALIWKTDVFIPRRTASTDLVKFGGSYEGSLDAEPTATLVLAFVTCRIDYRSSVLVGAPRALTDKLQRVLNVAAARRRH